MGDLFQIFVTSRNTEFLIESNFWLRIYMLYILKFRTICDNKLKFGK